MTIQRMRQAGTRLVVFTFVAVFATLLSTGSPPTSSDIILAKPTEPIYQPNPGCGGGCW
jgi:hypothetical protein